MRRGVLFRALSGDDRGYMWLTMRVVDRVRSVAAGRIILKILCRLRDALKGGFVRRMEEYGFGRVRELAEQAVGWGYVAAGGWSRDMGFVRYLTLLDVNMPSGWGS